MVFIQAKRVSFAFTRELDGAQLCKMFEAFERLDEIVETSEQLERGSRVCGVWEEALAWLEAQAGDLAGAGADDEVERRLILNDDCFECAAEGCVALERMEPDLEGFPRRVAHLLAQRLDALTHGVTREETAEDDPEPLHDRDCSPAGTPAESARGYPTNSEA